MSTKTLTKIIVALAIIATIVLSATIVFGSGTELLNNNNGDSTSASFISGPVKKILGIVSYICYAAAVILLIILGVKYMTASPDGKAEIKKSAVQYVIGAALVFAAGGILNIISNTSQSVAQ